MLNNLLINKGYKTIRVGIGVSSAQELIIKAGRKNTGINSKGLDWGICDKSFKSIIFR